MPATAPSAPPPTRSLKPGPFADRLAAFLLPYWRTLTEDYDLARADVEETIASYGARTRAELINAVQIIANSFAALDVLAEAKLQYQDLSPTMRLRYRGCANSLNRSCQYAQKALDKRLSCDVPQAPQPAAEPHADVSDDDAAEILRRTQAAIDACRNRLANAQPAILPNGALNFPPDRSQRRSASAIMQALSAGGSPKGVVAPPMAAAASGP
jgi:hypothetical protein